MAARAREEAVKEQASALDAVERAAAVAATEQDVARRNVRREKLQAMAGVAGGA